MLALGFAPNASQLLPVRVGQSLTDLLWLEHAFEAEIIQLYDQARRHSARVGAHDDRLFFEGLWQEELAHQQSLLEWLEQLQGGQLATQESNSLNRPHWR